MCGLPSSGKTYLVDKLVQYFSGELKKNTLVVNDASYTETSKNSIYQGLIFFF